MKLLVLDTETTGLPNANPEPELIEVAAALYCTESKIVLSTVQFLLPIKGQNNAEHINHIPEKALKELDEEITGVLTDTFLTLYNKCDFVVAHNVKFDKYFIEKQWAVVPTFIKKKWICTYEELVFPLTKKSLVLTHIAVDHCIMPTDMHRALGDVTTLINLLGQITDIDKKIHDVVNIRENGFYYVTNNTNAARAANFRFNFDRKQWGKHLLPEDAAKLNFHVQKSS